MLNNRRGMAGDISLAKASIGGIPLPVIGVALAALIAALIAARRRSKK